ncbi:uncharacterized protein LY89DRAFT_665907 [Mollisia scopiformis]|uniref:Uncharacterized protein n=1 Tax=Mollisia scopiformis TaxID=149040 RepID=A0A194XN16_MOLSC|nr:uncharacterized protein LY89DRAFT_665907 [Mollisia scopiformis]KUJ21479.1 hypothetical protein LY89DRAFT_665907 [Mollisia scopiformis]
MCRMNDVGIKHARSTSDDNDDDDGASTATTEEGDLTEQATRVHKCRPERATRVQKCSPSAGPGPDEEANGHQIVRDDVLYDPTLRGIVMCYAMMRCNPLSLSRISPACVVLRCSFSNQRVRPAFLYDLFNMVTAPGKEAKWNELSKCSIGTCTTTPQPSVGIGVEVCRDSQNLSQARPNQDGRTVDSDRGAEWSSKRQTTTTIDEAVNYCFALLQRRVPALTRMPAASSRRSWVNSLLRSGSSGIFNGNRFSHARGIEETERRNLTIERHRIDDGMDGSKVAVSEISRYLDTNDGMPSIKVQYNKEYEKHFAVLDSLGTNPLLKSDV